MDHRPSTNGHLHILVVDDEPINQAVLKSHLENEQYHITQAMNGEEALRVLNSGQKFDLVLLDVMMPRMSGYEVCEQIRKKYLPSQLPIIMVTAKNQVEDLVQGLGLGANDYLPKPFSKQEFLARVKTQLNLHQINAMTSKFVPNEFLANLGYQHLTDIRLGDQVEKHGTVLFADIRNYTGLSESMTPEENFRFLNAYLGRMGPVIKQHGGFVNQFYGDGIMALFLREPADALRAAIAMQQELQSYNREREPLNRKPLKVGIGLHSGPLMMGMIGDEDRFDTGLVSDAVNTAARMEGLTKEYDAGIILSETVYGTLTGDSDFAIDFLGEVPVRGKQEPMRIYGCKGEKNDE